MPSACLTPPELNAPPAAALTSPATPVAVPLDDPKTCIDPVAGPPVACAWETSATDQDAIAAEFERQILERSSQLHACRRDPEEPLTVLLNVGIGADGTSRVLMLAATLPECPVFECLRKELSGLPIAPAQADRDVWFGERVSLAPGGPIHTERASYLFETKDDTPPITLSCLDGVRRGRLEPGIIQSHVRAQFGSFSKCYQAGLGRNPSLTGRLVLQFAIGSHGKILWGRIDDTDLPDCGVVRCVRDQVMQLQFPPPEGGIVTVQYPILLQPG